MNYFKKAASILLVAFLTACGGGDSDGGSNDNVAGKVDNPIAANIIKSVLVEPTSVAYQSTIDLNERIIDPNNLSLKIDDYSMTGPGCSANVDGLVFNIESSRESVCNISYRVTNVLADGTNGKASIGTISNIFSSYVDPYLPTISLAAEVGSTHTIDLKAELGDLYPTEAELESEIFYTAGRSTVTPNISTSSITVSAGNDPEVVQIRYSLKDSAEKVKFGIITVTISDNLNLAPSAAKKYLEVDPNSSSPLVVDVSSLISDPDNSVNELQLLSVDSFDDIAYIPQANAEVINNKVFEVKVPVTGTYDIMYTVTDHNGGYASAIIRVFVEAKKPWEDILLPDGKLYTAPWEKSIADAYGLLYDSFYEETINGVKYSVPKFTQSYASTLCMSRGMMLPSIRMLDFLHSQKGDVKISDGWPTDDLYWTSDTNVAYNLRTGAEVLISGNSPELHTFTCVYPGLLSTSVITNQAYTTGTLSARNFNEVSVHLSDLFSSPVPNQLVSMFPQEYPSSLIFDSNVILTNVNGNGSFKIQSPSAGVVNVCAKYLSQSLCETIEFIQDKYKTFYVSPEATELLVTKSTRLSAWIQYDSDDYDVTREVSRWQPSNDVVTVDSTGLVTGAKVGTSLVSAFFTDSSGVERSAASVITVKDSASSCEVRPESISLAVGDSQKLTLWCTQLSGSVIEVPASDTSWSTASPNLSVDSNGNVTALTYSSSDLLVSASMKSNPSLGGTATVNITDTVQSCRLDPSSASLNIGGEQQLTLTCQYSSGSKSLAPNQVNWSSSNSAIVSINSSTGRAKALAPSATPVAITARPKDNVNISSTSMITVESDNSWGTDGFLEVTPNQLVARVNQTYTLTAIAHTKNGSIDVTSSATWSSKGVGSVNKGVVSSSVGGDQTVTVSYTLNGVQKTAVANISWNALYCDLVDTTTFTGYTNPGAPTGSQIIREHLSVLSFSNRKFGNKVGHDDLAIFSVSALRINGSAIAETATPVVIASDNVKDYAIGPGLASSITITELYDPSKSAWAMIQFTSSSGKKCTIRANLVPD
ncbi:Ig-like domain-containing protein [Photobacterium damselae]